jgi:hypothetical protein
VAAGSDDDPTDSRFSTRQLPNRLVNPYGRVTAPSEADVTWAAYLANTPVR